MMIVCNDVMAYMFGFFFGKTPLIKLSPKKTWEGFIGGGFATVAFGVIFSYFLCRYQYFVCPIEYSETAGKILLDCEPSYLFRPQIYGIRIVRHLMLAVGAFYLKLCFYFLGSTRNCHCYVSILIAFLIAEHFQFSNWSVWWVLCLGIQARI